jgi:exo-1,4-beta-D-glucosaminidase
MSRLVIAELLASLLWPVTPARSAPPAPLPVRPTALPGRPGALVPVGGRDVRSSAEVTADGTRISRPDFAPTGWLRAGARSTVMAALAHRYPGVFHSTHGRDRVDHRAFTVPWWYREEFTARPHPGVAPRTFLRLPGAISRAEVWVNGVQRRGPWWYREEFTARRHRGTTPHTFLRLPGAISSAEVW